MWPVQTYQMARRVNFYSHIPCGMWLDKWLTKANALIVNFYSHIPCGMWHQLTNGFLQPSDFYSHIPCGMWRCWCVSGVGATNFYSHIPCGMWRQTIVQSWIDLFHFYSHIPCGMWLIAGVFIETKDISTHTSRVGCDTLPMMSHTLTTISTHTSRVGCDVAAIVAGLTFVGFLLTHPVWDVTSSSFSQDPEYRFLLTHPVWDVTMFLQ